MFLKPWEELPYELRLNDVKKYYDVLYKKRHQLFLKRLFDIVASFLLIVVFSPLILILSIVIKLDSKGPVFFRQVRITANGREFKIFKFRSMIINAENIGTQITHKDDKRITKVGKFIRKYRFDEIVQIFNVLTGDMSFVGTRPEVPKYVNKYSNEMLATLLLPAGITSNASIKYKDEEKLLENADDVDSVYINVILPEKMKYNLEYLKNFSLINDFKIMIKTFIEVIK
ncbi:MAG: sugar transferase [Candidatus Fimenecus sp.]